MPPSQLDISSHSSQSTMLRDWSFNLGNIQVSGLSTLSYIFDFLFYTIILVLSATLGHDLPPRYHEFLIYDLSIKYTYISNTTVPLWLLAVISGGIPFAQFLMFALFTRNRSIERRLWDFFAGILCLLGALATQLWAVVLLKNFTGLPRPDMIHRCQPMFFDSDDGGDDDDDEHYFYQNNIIDFTQLSTVAICSQPDWNLIMEGFRSFPSGHASTVFCGMVITSLNMAAHLQTFDYRNNSFKVFLTMAPLFCAAFVASTRVSDNRHYLQDVIAGSLLGGFVGFAFYHQYHPSVFNLRNHGRAFPPRRFGVDGFRLQDGGFWTFNNDNDPNGGEMENNEINANSGVNLEEANGGVNVNGGVNANGGVNSNGGNDERYVDGNNVDNLGLDKVATIHGVNTKAVINNDASNRLPLNVGKERMEVA